jgi:GNAT superfamily N-acetyltransferase
MDSSSIQLRFAKSTDLDAINAVVTAAVMQWDLPERVKRLALSSYHYSEHDFSTMGFMVAEDRATHQVVGIAAWEPAHGTDLPPQRTGLLLHGLYVLPQRQGAGVGAKLFSAVEKVAGEEGYHGIVVKAQSGAGGFFRRQGMDKLRVEDDERDYAHRYWKALS